MGKQLMRKVSHTGSSPVLTTKTNNMEKLFELLPPLMPNYVIFKVNGNKVHEPIPIESFTRQEAEEYAELMKQTFIKHWENKQNK